jgi:PAS domain S-box-containing protein
VFGYTTEEMIGQSIRLLIPPENVDEEYTIWGKVKSGQRVDHFETIRRAKDLQDLNWDFV